MAKHSAMMLRRNTRRALARAFVVILAVSLVSTAASAETSYRPPYDKAYGAAYPDCEFRGASDRGSRCTSVFVAQADTGRIGVWVSVTSPRAGSRPGAAGTEANAWFQFSTTLAEATPEVTGTMKLNVASGGLTHTCPKLCVLPDGMGSMDIQIQGLTDGPECCIGGSKTLLAGNNSTNFSDADSTVAPGVHDIPFRLRAEDLDGNPDGVIPVGHFEIYIMLSVYVGLDGPFIGTPFHYGTVKGSLDGTLEAVVFDQDL